ncbi:MAG: NAD(+) synthase [Bacillota bacterium]
MHVEKLCHEICGWLKDQVFSSGGKGGVFGLSGGIDSAVVGVLCKKAFAEQCLALVLPCHSQAEDMEHALALAHNFQIPCRVVELDAVFDQFLLALGEEKSTDKKDLSLANIKPRLRMNTLYYYASRLSYRVIGTGNKSEISVGYFTKYGDGGVDFEPIGDLLKEEVYELARYLEIPEYILQKKPSGGLWEGQDDETEMGITYAELDRYLKGETVDAAVAEKIRRRQRYSLHKQKMPPIFAVKG